MNRVLVVGKLDYPEQSRDQLVTPVDYYDGTYFVTTAVPGNPIPFRLHGFLPLDCFPSGHAGSTEYVGELKLSPTPPSKRSSLSGTITTGLNEDPSRYTVIAETGDPHSTIYEDLGYLYWKNEHHYYQWTGKRGYGPQSTNVARDGSFSFSSLSPITYRLRFVNADRISPFAPLVLVRPGEQLRLRPFRIPESKVFQISYSLSNNPDSLGSETKSVEMQGCWGGSDFRKLIDRGRDTFSNGELIYSLRPRPVSQTYNTVLHGIKEITRDTTRKDSFSWETAQPRSCPESSTWTT